MTEDRIKVVVDADLEAIVPAYLQRRRDEIADLRAAVADGDCEKLQRIGHNLKGTGGGYGFELISEYGAAIEDAGRSRDPSQARAIIEALAAYLEKLHVTYG
jgi:HPt (histidine-containing phosphotransfer) domain-containing protein